MLAGRVAATLAAAGYSSILSIQMAWRFIQAPKLAGSDWTCEGHLLTVALQFNFKSR